MKANAAQAYTEKTRQECLAFPSTVFGMFDVRLVGFIVRFYAKFLDHIEAIVTMLTVLEVTRLLSLHNCRHPLF